MQLSLHKLVKDATRLALASALIGGAGFAASSAKAAGSGVYLPMIAADSTESLARSARADASQLKVHMVRFKKGTSEAAMQAAVAAAGGTVTNNLSKINRMAVDANGNAGFAAAMAAQANVERVTLDKFITHGRFDVNAADTTATGNPQLGSPGVNNPPDPWHNLDAFLNENAPGVLQWDDERMNVAPAWATTQGQGIVVAVLDTGVQGSHKELQANYDNQNSVNTIPCNLLTRQFGPQLGQRDCSSEDTEGHGTWVASRILGAANGFASNGVAPKSRVIGVKVLSTMLGGGLTSWIVDGMIRACDSGAHLINMSLGGFNAVGTDDEDTMAWVDATNYCRAKGTAILASAGNNHLRINRVTLSIDGNMLTGVGQVDLGAEGFQLSTPGSTLAANDYRGLIETPAGIPGVIMVSSLNNANGTITDAGVPTAVRPPAGVVGKQDQLAYYSNYGSRIDIAAPGGARKYNIPRFDGGPGDVLYGGWGTLGALTGNGEICSDPSLASLLTFACFKVTGSAFGWLQGTSMSSPNATGVAALALGAHPSLRGNPDALLAHLKSTARTNMVNHTGPNDATNLAASYAGVPCSSGYCHINFANPIPFSDAYGAGMVNAAAAVSTGP